MKPRIMMMAVAALLLADAAWTQEMIFRMEPRSSPSGAGVEVSLTSNAATDYNIRLLWPRPRVELAPVKIRSEIISELQHTTPRSGRTETQYVSGNIQPYWEGIRFEFTTAREGTLTFVISIAADDLERLMGVGTGHLHLVTSGRNPKTLNEFVAHWDIGLARGSPPQKEKER